MSEIPYILLRASLELFQKPPHELNSEQLKQAQGQAQREYDIESRALNSAEAASVVINDADVERSYLEIRERFPNEEAFVADLARNNLDAKTLREALSRQSKVTSILEKVSARAPTANEVEIGIFYHSNIERFQQPERREAYHILISINDDYEDNTRDKAYSRLQKVAEKLKKKPEKFGQMALRHSECPTALSEGKLGTTPRGKLYPELDKVLFELEQGVCSNIVESPMGFHLMLCKKIHPAATMPLKEAAPKIRKMLENRYQRNCQKAWLANLPPLKK